MPRNPHNDHNDHDYDNRSRPVNYDHSTLDEYYATSVHYGSVDPPIYRDQFGDTRGSGVGDDLVGVFDLAVGEVSGRMKGREEWSG
jgi:hypothetical protein